MALEVTELVRVFKYNSIELKDPGEQFTVEQVKDLYAATYSDIVNATIEGPEQVDGKQVYTFRRAVGTKGAGETHVGVSLIAAERARQVAEEGYDTAHDDEHTDHSLALAACAYAAPVPLYQHLNFGEEHQFSDIWPDTWANAFDRRPRDAEGLLPAGDQTPEDRIRCLVKAGALIAAEIDRIQRIPAEAYPFPAKKHG